MQSTWKLADLTRFGPKESLNGSSKASFLESCSLELRGIAQYLSNLPLLHTIVHISRSLNITHTNTVNNANT